MEYSVRAENLRKRFRDIEAVRGLNLSVPSQSVYRFLGPDGPGKSTTIRMILGLQRPTNGLDPAGIHEIRSVVRDLPKRIFIIPHPEWPPARINSTLIQEGLAVSELQLRQLTLEDIVLDLTRA